MIEMGYYETNLYTLNFFDWIKTFELLNHIKNELEEIKGFSYNRYSGDRPLAQLKIRCDFKDDTGGISHADDLLSDLMTQKIIVGCDDWKPFNATQTVKKATELSSTCAFSLNDWMMKNQEILGQYIQNTNFRIEFLTRFEAILLNKLGFKVHFEKYPLGEERLEIITNCADVCSIGIKENFERNPDITFLERFIHHFHNCVFIDAQTESAIYFHMMKWNWMGNILSTKKET